MLRRPLCCPGVSVKEITIMNSIPLFFSFLWLLELVKCSIKTIIKWYTPTRLEEKKVRSMTDFDWRRFDIKDNNDSLRGEGQQVLPYFVAYTHRFMLANP